MKKKCQVITKGGAECIANGSHAVPVWKEGAFAYPINEHQISNIEVNVCGAHKQVLTRGNPVKISIINTVVDNQPKEGINMQYNCDICKDTGIDPSFMDDCKCKYKASASEVTKKQSKFMDDLIREITAIMKVDLNWARVNDKKEASEVIDILKATKVMVVILKAKKAKLTTEQIESIRSKINAKPTTEWIQKATKKLVTF